MVGGIGRLFGRLGERAALRSALDFEEEIHGLYESLSDELAGQTLPEELLRVLSDEREHKRLLHGILEGRISDEEAQAVLSRGRFHELERVRPLDRDRLAPLREKLGHIREREGEIRQLFRSLCRRTKLPAASRVLCFLAAQEDVHVQLLERLLMNPHAQAK
jgi:rubrerythrin